MSYNNYRYEPNGQHNYNSRAPYNRQAPTKKKTGAKMGMDKKQRPCITAWNVSQRRGFITLVAVPCAEFKIVPKDKNKKTVCHKWVASIKFADGKKTFTAFYNPITKKLTIPDLDMVVNPSKNYFGTFVKRK